MASVGTDDASSSSAEGAVEEEEALDELKWAAAELFEPSVEEPYCSLLPRRLMKRATLMNWQSCPSYW